MKCASLPLVALMTIHDACTAGAPSSQRWSTQQAWQWYNSQPWIVGCNYIPATAINQLEMWQAETFDPIQIDRELGWAQSTGFNAVRVFLHAVVWEQDSSGFIGSIERFLEIADRHRIRAIFVLFDDCWNDDPKPGTQPSPRPGVHNSGWMQCPGKAALLDTSTYHRLESYTTGLIRRFGGDRRVLLWDLYNEPGNSGYGARTLPLLKRVVTAARAASPAQPLSIGVWMKPEGDFAGLNDYQTSASDIITFHQYSPLNETKEFTEALRKYHRPIVCTEYMARTRGSTFRTHLPYWKQERIGAISWGLVSGKTQTIFPWGSKEGSPEPVTWFHDIFRPDGGAYDPEETALMKSHLGVQ